MENYGSISTVISLPEPEQNTEPVELIEPEERPKQKIQISVDTLGKVNCD